LKLQLRAYDPKILHTLLALGNIFTVVFFVWGFFLFRWFAPLLGLFVIPLALSFVYHATRRPNWFFALKDQASIVIGLGLCSYAVLAAYL
jgi:presenilin-like A22 family membrane protease